MKILMINKFLYPNGGSETYIFKLGEALQKEGHEVQYFGMDHKDRIVGNAVNAYTSTMDFHTGSKWSKLLYPVRTVYSFEARRKIRMVLNDFRPDICHLNNFNFQLTPSIILEIVKWRKEANKKCRIVFTAHDYQLVCPNHLCNNPKTHQNCEKCLGGNFLYCIRGKCIHGSVLRSAIGSMEAFFWKALGVYKNLDVILCCSDFMKTKMDTNPVFANKTVAMHNFVDRKDYTSTKKKDYVLYFGRYSQEKGIATLLEVCRQLPQIPFIFAGSGPLEDMLKGVENIRNVGFQEGENLKNLIAEARFAICPSEWYENCPFSVMESQLYGTAVLAADIGGLPELIHNGRLFESGNADDLRQNIIDMWENDVVAVDNAKWAEFFDDTKEYCSKLMDYYC